MNVLSDVLPVAILPSARNVGWWADVLVCDLSVGIGDDERTPTIPPPSSERP